MVAWTSPEKMDTRWKHRLKELTRLREEACRSLEPETITPDLRKYFFQFAAFGRRNK
jgi:hypothetical protein